MEKQTIFNVEKQQLELLVRELNLDNVDEVLAELRQHISIISIISNTHYRNADECKIYSGIVTEFEADLTADEDADIISETKPPVIIEEHNEDLQLLHEKCNQFDEAHQATILQEEEAKDGRWVIGQLKRELKGGHIGKNIYVPESIIRRNDFQNNDWIKAESTNFNKNNKRRYNFSLLEKNSDMSTGIEISRKVAEFAYVFYDEILKIHYINVKDGDSLKMRVRLSEEDIRNLNIMKGDIIEYAYWENDLLSGRATWKHRFQEETSSPTITMPVTIKSEKDNKKEKRISELKYNVRPIYENLTIIMVGGVHRNLQRGIKEEVERRQGKFVFCTGDERKSILECRIRKADAVIVFTESISHEGMYSAKEFCKKYNIPVSYTKNLGNRQFVSRVNRLLNIKVNEHNIGPIEPGFLEIAN